MYCKSILLFRLAFTFFIVNLLLSSTACKKQDFPAYDVMVDDRDGKTYPTIEVGGYIWMAKNLNIGSMLDSNYHEDEYITDNCIGFENPILQTNNGAIEKYCYNNDVANCDDYGGLYQWDEATSYEELELEPDVSVQGICPAGWRIPSYKDWQRLEEALGMDEVQVGRAYWHGDNEGDQLKVSGDCKGDDKCGCSGFDALLGGTRHPSGNFSAGQDNANFWTTTIDIDNTCQSLFYSVSKNREEIFRGEGSHAAGFAVRCIKKK